MPGDGADRAVHRAHARAAPSSATTTSTSRASHCRCIPAGRELGIRPLPDRSSTNGRTSRGCSPGRVSRDRIRDGCALRHGYTHATVPTAHERRGSRSSRAIDVRRPSSSSPPRRRVRDRGVVKLHPASTPRRSAPRARRRGTTDRPIGELLGGGEGNALHLLRRWPTRRSPRASRQCSCARRRTWTSTSSSRPGVGWSRERRRSSARRGRIAGGSATSGARAPGNGARRGPRRRCATRTDAWPLPLTGAARHGHRPCRMPVLTQTRRYSALTASSSRSVYAPAPPGFPFHSQWMWLEMS